MPAAKTPATPRAKTYTEAQLIAAMDAAAEQIGREMLDTQWGFVSQTICKLAKKYTLERIKRNVN